MVPNPLAVEPLLATTLGTSTTPVGAAIGDGECHAASADLAVGSPRPRRKPLRCGMRGAPLQAGCLDREINWLFGAGAMIDRRTVSPRGRRPKARQWGRGPRFGELVEVRHGFVCPFVYSGSRSSERRGTSPRRGLPK